MDEGPILSKREKEIIENLSLCMHKGNSPFSAVGRENYFRPEDWAWQFLRLNDAYKVGYKNASTHALVRQKSERHFTDGTQFADRKLPMRALLENEAQCRKDFGISTWLDPNEKELPKLSDNESWFSPLIPVEPIFGSDLGPEPPLSENLYGYGELPPNSPRRKHLHRHDYEDYPSAVWFVVDCAIPIESQILGIRNCGKTYATWLKSLRTAPTRPTHTCKPMTLGEYREFAGVVNRAKAPTKRERDERAYVSRHKRIICIDTLGPIVTQLGKYMPELQKVHKKSSWDQEVALPIRQRDRRSSRTASDGTVLTDGHPYKCLIVVAQMTKADLDPREIERIICTYVDASIPTESAWADWIYNRPLRISEYKKKATEFIERGYRWIVQAQKSG